MPQTPQDWRDTLDSKLTARLPQVQLYEDYYAGNHRLAFATNKFREAFGHLFAAFSDNWCKLVVDTSVQRLQVEGFRFGDSPEADAAAWDVWQRNNLDRYSRIGHTEAVKSGIAYVFVDPTKGFPRVTIEHASQVIVECDPADRSNRLAAFKRYLDTDGYMVCWVYLPEAFYCFKSQRTVDKVGAKHYEWSDTPTQVVRNPLGVVPIVPLENDPMLLSGGVSDLDVMIPLNDMMNKMATDMAVASEFSAYRQRIVTGIEIPKDPLTGEPVGSTELRSAMSRLWTFEGPDVKVSELSQTDLTNYTHVMDLLATHIGALTSIPPHYMLGKTANLSADALKASETGLVAKVQRKQTDFGDTWETVMALCLQAQGKTDQANMHSETIWSNPESRAMGVVVDGLVKLRTLGVPLETLWEIYGFSPQQIGRMKHMAGLPDRPPPGATLAQVTPRTALGSNSPTSPAAAPTQAGIQGDTQQ